MLNLLLPLLRLQAYIQIRARAEHPPVTRHDYAFHTVVYAEHLEGFFEFSHHVVCEGVVGGGAVEGEKNDGGDFGGLGGVVR